MKGSRLTPIVLGLTWIVSLGFVFALGILSTLSFHARPGEGAESALTPPEREASAVFQQLTGESLDWAALRSYSPRDRHPPQLDMLWEALGEEPSRQERWVLTRRFFRELGPVKTGALVAQRAPLASEAPVRFSGLWAAWHDRDAATAEAFRDAMLASGELGPGAFSELE